MNLTKYIEHLAMRLSPGLSTTRPVWFRVKEDDADEIVLRLQENTGWWGVRSRMIIGRDCAAGGYDLLVE